MVVLYVKCDEIYTDSDNLKILAFLILCIYFAWCIAFTRILVSNQKFSIEYSFDYSVRTAEKLQT